jgi:prepilin-type N-terminal cleavage/methylation domain-containing protein
MKKYFQIQSAPIKQRGFTLIEILLVLVLVAALAAAGIAAYQVQQRNFKVEKTALQMQLWLQAGQAYYADCGVWPEADFSNNRQMYGILTGQNPIDTCKNNTQYQGTYRAYMPPNSEFGIWSAPTGNAANIFEMAGYCPPSAGPSCSSPSFYVSTVLKNDQGTETIGKMIAGRLPSGVSVLAGGGIKVTGYVNAVGAAQGGNPIPPGGGGGSIVDMEIVSPGQTAKHLKLPTTDDCADGMIPVLVHAISGLDAGTYRPRNAFAGLSQSSLGGGASIDKNGFIADMKSDVGTNKIQPVFNIQPDQDNPENWNPGSGNQLLFISACVPDPEAKAKAKALQKSQNQSAPGTRY